MAETYTLKLDKKVANLLEELSRKMKVSQSSVIERALLLYRKEVEKEELLKNLISSAEELSKDEENLKEIKELEPTVGDGIN
jgi:predicted transcriptional regulator